MRRCTKRCAWGAAQQTWQQQGAAAGCGSKKAAGLSSRHSRGSGQAAPSVADDSVRCWCRPAPASALPSIRIEEWLQSLSDTKAYNILHLRAEDDWIEHCVHWEGIADGERRPRGPRGGRQEWAAAAAAAAAAEQQAHTPLTTSAPAHVHARGQFNVTACIS